MEVNGVADEITVTLHNKKVYKAKVIGKRSQQRYCCIKD